MLNWALRFKGVFRPYQQRVIDRFQEYIKDNKFHIVAAPGSGKTTLGIELIRKLDKNTLVLVPSITIREQWVKRISEGFLVDGLDIKDYVSNDLKNLKPITVSTYQAINSAFSKFKGDIKEEFDEETNLVEQVDYSDVDIVKTLNDFGVETLCLDECHHLRSEWWRSLEKLKTNVNINYTVSLTATPPYDSSYNEWQRYLEMCGEIDEEISIPELVKAQNLCPHQDYIYFNYPTEKENAKLQKFQQSLDNLVDTLMIDQEFSEIVLSYPLAEKQYDMDLLLDNPKYLSSILVFFNDKGETIPEEIKETMGYKSLEPMSAKWLEILLQNVLFDDTRSYMISLEQKERYINKLKSLGFLEKKRVMLSMKGKLKRELVRSIGKCESIKTITFHEYSLLQEKLRLLILCDYIKKEFMSAVGDSSRNVEALGVVPLFEMLRRQSEQNGTNILLAGLSGTIAIIPNSAKKRLLEISGQNERISFKSIGCLNDQSYLEVTVSGDRHILTGIITKLFEEGEIQVLIGTKSLLGEGWDSPCVNTLILASFVGSFMLSNQMRGRAIRTQKGNPEKTSHIWHLACIAEKTKDTKNIDLAEASEDLDTISRRMATFLGLHYTEETIENGTFRISNIEQPLSEHKNVFKTNKSMLELSSKRNELKERWQKALEISEKIEIIEEVNKLYEEKFFGLWSLKRLKLIINIFSAIVWVIYAGIYITGVMLEYGNYALPGLILLAIMIFSYVVVFVLIKNSDKIYYWFNPIKSLKKVAHGIYVALKSELLVSNTSGKVEHEKIGAFDIVYLRGCPGKDKALFAKTIEEFYSEIDNQRYILFSEKRRYTNRGYFVIPEILSKNKQQAENFAAYISTYVEPFEAVYTRNSDGRKLLLEARKYAFINQEKRALTKKKVKSALE